jgi:hypothetical protein
MFKHYGLFFHVGLDPFPGVIHWCKVWWTVRNPKLIVHFYLNAAWEIGGTHFDSSCLNWTSLYPYGMKVFPSSCRVIQVQNTSVTDLQGPPSGRTQSDKIRDLKSLAKQYARDRGSCDDTRISYLEYVESEAEADWTLARMIAG